MSNQPGNESTSKDSGHHRDSNHSGEPQMVDRLSRISTQANLALNEHTTDAERTKLYFKYAIAFESFLRQHLKQDPPPADISDAIWKKFMKMKFEHRGPGSFRKYLGFVLNSSIATYQVRRQKLQVSDMLDLEESLNTRIEWRKTIDVSSDKDVSKTSHVPPEESDSGQQQGGDVSEDFEHYTTRLKAFLQQKFPADSLTNMLASDGDIKSMVRGVLQTISWERLNQIGQESRRLDQEAKKSGKKRGDSRWRYILAIQTCAQLRIDCDRSTADAGKLALRLAALVGQPALSGELAKKWASRGSQIYASVVIECAAEMFGTHDRESLAVEIVDLGLLSIKSIGMLVRDGDIKSMVRGVLQTISWERLNQIGQESRRLDQEAKKSGKKRGDSRWRYILATQTCAQLRIDCDRSTADVEKLVLRLATLVGQSNLSGDLAKKWASRGSQLYASVIIECAAEMFDTQDRESLAAELADLGLLNIKFIKDALQNTLDSEE